ncbi:polysaccharide biosynthesis protein [Acholeplasma equifetale]|uniref:polysaccharide biosynthesis protein n=1 Tax=Acholeplasma equifetale TaxID=264634 RepID=UPI00068BA935|nr:nucleoside-diphosphate sugar epimerase/dehydratase [Acholeplasma equifetale]
MAIHSKYPSILHALKYVLFDSITIILSYLLSIWLFGFMGIQSTDENLIIILPIIVVFKIFIYVIAGIYNMLTRHTGFEDVIKISALVIFTNLGIVLIIMLTGLTFMFKSAYVFISLIEISGLIFPRILRRTYRTVITQFRWMRSDGVRTLIVGAGQAGELTIKEIYQNKDLNNIPVAILDDDYNKIGKKLLGVSITGTLKDIERTIHKYQIQEAIISIKDLPKARFIEIVNELLKLGVKVRKLNIMEDVDQVNSKNLVVDVNLEDLLNREIINLDNEGINDFIKDQVVLVTGGGGSIGSELCRQIFNLGPKKLVIFDIYENNAYDIQMELQRKIIKESNKKYPDLEVRIGSVYNYQRLEEIFEEFRPSLVFHAAAYKHVPLMEDSPVEAIRTNVLGTYNAVKLADKYNVKKFVLVSSDKAVRPTNIMGATKRLAELILETMQQKSKTSFSAVRFGNVLGSNGSVIPLFKKQIADGGPVTVTHKEITRYFMTIPEAVGLILQCGVYADKGELFILDMGEPVKIYDLAEKMIALAGFVPHQDIKIDIVGLRPGEKLYEELLVDSSDQSRFHKTENNLIFIEKEKEISLDQNLFNELLSKFESLDDEEIKNFVSKIIPSYTPDKMKKTSGN